MNSATTLRVRRISGWLAASWAMLAVGFSIFSLMLTSSGLAPPVTSFMVGGEPVIQGASHAARAAGIEPGGR
ncbi:MAG: hypothetical protein VCC04_06105, partial [Myxococcota bacterium]